MLRRFYFVKDVGYATLLVQQESLSCHTHIFSAVHRLLDPHAIRLTHHLLGVGEQREVQLVLRAEVLMRTLAVRAHTHDAETTLGECFLAITQTLCLECTSRGVVLGIEVEHRLAALEVCERQCVAILRW